MIILNERPHRKIPDEPAKIIGIIRQSEYIVECTGQFAPQCVTLVEGPSERQRKLGEEGTLVYYSWNRADHHRHWQFFNDQDIKAFLKLGLRSPLGRK